MEMRSRETKMIKRRRRKGRKSKERKRGGRGGEGKALGGNNNAESDTFLVVTRGVYRDDHALRARGPAVDASTHSRPAGRRRCHQPHFIPQKPRQRG